MSNEIEVRRSILRVFSDDVIEATHKLKEPALHDAIDALYEKLKDDLSWSFIREREQGK